VNSKVEINIKLDKELERKIVKFLEKSNGFKIMKSMRADINKEELERKLVKFLEKSKSIDVIMQGFSADLSNYAYAGFALKDGNLVQETESWKFFYIDGNLVQETGSWEFFFTDWVVVRASKKEELMKALSLEAFATVTNIYRKITKTKKGC
jgi:hypothetical protein